MRCKEGRKRDGVPDYGKEKKITVERAGAVNAPARLTVMPDFHIKRRFPGFCASFLRGHGAAPGTRISSRS